MKTPVTVTMLIVGGALLITPFAFNAIHEHAMAVVLTTRHDISTLTFGNVELLSPYGCWATGAGLCIAAIWGAIKDARRSRERAGDAHLATAATA